ncbi:MAG: hypothetical protein EXQ71_04425 [Acidimicrobiia bacterium]|nr:hypothetical protein [Acidimicrobiia bacterium]
MRSPPFGTRPEPRRNGAVRRRLRPRSPPPEPLSRTPPRRTPPPPKPAPPEPLSRTPPRRTPPPPKPAARTPPSLRSTSNRALLSRATAVLAGGWVFVPTGSATSAGTRIQLHRGQIEARHLIGPAEVAPKPAR